MKFIQFFFLFFISGAHAQNTLMLPLGHCMPISKAEFNKQGNRIITASDDHNIKLWDTQSGALLQNIVASDYAAFSPDGNFYIFHNNGSGTIRNCQNNKLLHVLKADIKIAVFSNDGKKIATSDRSNLIVWDVATGAREFNVDHTNSNYINTLQFSPNGAYILTASTSNKEFRIWDAKTGLLVKEIKEHKNGIDNAKFSPDGAILATSSYDRSTKFWSVNSWELLATITPDIDNSARSVEFSPDGKRVVIPFNSSNLKIYSTATWGELLTIPGPQKGQLHQRGFNYAEFSPDGKIILTAANDNSVRIWDAENGDELGMIVNDNGIEWFDYLYLAHYSNDMNSILLVSSDRAYTYDAHSLKRIHILGKTLDISNLKYSPDKNKILAFCKTNNTVRLLDRTQAKVLYSITNSYDTQDACFSYDGEKFIIAGGNVCVYDVSSGILLDSFTCKSDPKLLIAASDNNSIIILESRGYEIWHLNNTNPIPFKECNREAFAISPDNSYFVVSCGENSVTVHSMNTGENLNSLYRPSGRVNEISISSDSKKIATACWHDSVVLIYNAQDGKLLLELKADMKGVDKIAFSPDGKKIATISNDQMAYIWDVETGKVLQSLKINTVSCIGLKFSNDGKYLCLNIITELWSFGNEFWFWNLKTGFLDRNFNKYENTFLYDIDFKKTQLIGAQNGLVRIFDYMTKFNLDQTSEIFAMLPISNTDFISYYLSDFKNNEFYYYGTPEGAKNIHFISPDFKVVSFEQLDLKYNRPDKVLQHIGCNDTALIHSYKRAYQKRMKKLQLDTNAFRQGFSVPDADFINRQEVQYTQTQPRLKVKISASDKTLTLDRFNVWINDVPLYGQKGISLKNRKIRRIDTTLFIALSEGENRIETSVTSTNGIESYRSPLFVNYIPATASKPHVYFVGIGIDHFADATYNLRFSSKDIRDLALEMKNKFGENVSIDTLFNENVTTATVKALKKKLMQSTPDDKVIVSYSGHGLLSKDFDYYLSTYNIQFNKPEVNGLPYDELENLLDSIPARKKLMFIDACHSGEVDRDEAFTIAKTTDSLHIARTGVLLVPAHEQKLGLNNSFELMQGLFANVGKNTGATVISAAAGNQFALEGGKLQNGVFTYCILNAMKNNSSFSIAQLKKEVSEEVVTLTGGLQKPTSRQETLHYNWDVW